MAYKTTTVVRKVITTLAINTAVAVLMFFTLFQPIESVYTALQVYGGLSLVMSVIAFLVFSLVKVDKIKETNMDNIEYMVSNTYQILIMCILVLDIAEMVLFIVHDYYWFAAVWTVGVVTTVQGLNWAHKLKTHMDNMVFETLRTSHT